MIKILFKATKSEFNGVEFATLVLLPLLFAVAILMEMSGAGALICSAFIFLPLAGVWVVSFVFAVLREVKRGDERSVC